jgi:polyhydroxybutyrate depolymerase
VRAAAGRQRLLRRDGACSADGRSCSNGRTTTAAPLILDLHGLRSTAFAQALYGRMADTGAARGFIVVEPESALGRQGWKLPGMPGGNDDIAYMSVFLDHLESVLCVDTTREYASGMSNGAGLAAALVCGLNGRLAAIAPVAGLNLARPCAGARPTTIVAFHGTADRIVPYRGGEPFGGNRRLIPGWMRPSSGLFALPAVSGLAARWARSFGCGASERSAVGNDVGGRGPAGRGVPEGSATQVSRVDYTGCQGGVRVDLYTVTGGAHAWPGALPLGIGGTTTRIDATKIILDAFSTSAR